MKGTNAIAGEHYRNERAWRKAGLSDRFDRTDPATSRRWDIARTAHRLYGRRTGGVGLDVWGDRLRPRAYRIFARREISPTFAAALATGLLIPDALLRYDGQQSGAIYVVVSVGRGVTSCVPGDRVAASSYVGKDLGDLLGDHIFELACDVVGAVQPGDCDVVRRSGGDVRAVVVE